MEIIIDKKETWIHAPAKSQVKAGVTMGANKVVAIVIDTDRATSPLAK